MRALAVVFGWLGRKGVLFLALVAALVAYQMIRPSYDSYRQLERLVDTGETARSRLPGVLAAVRAEGDSRLARAQAMPADAISARLGDARVARALRDAACGSDMMAALRGGAGAIVANRRACFERAMLDREIVMLGELQATADARRPGEPIEAALRRHAEAMRGSAATMRTVRAAYLAAGAQPLDRYRNRAQRQALAARYAETRAAGERAQAQAGRLIAARERTARASAAAEAAIGEARAAFERLAGERTAAFRATAANRLAAWSDRVGLPRILRTAAWLLAGIVLTPYLIRLFLYFVLAPIVMRRPAIRLRVPGGAGTPIAIPDRSAPSTAVRLEPGEELLVRQSFLQTTSERGTKGTQWLLDRRHPLTSLATGLTFLTRLRDDGGVTTVSAVADPFAEVTVLVLADGAACVLHPRALAAVVQPVARPLRVTSHWRLGSLNAWLTLQLRYLVFHGPARLVVKGGRGVRVERAEAGRIFGSDQLVGFSADLSYSVTRTETFWPYLLGREPLLKDRVRAGAGVLIVEEAPMAGRRGAGPRRGIEGLIDAGMKAFGL